MKNFLLFIINGIYELMVNLLVVIGAVYIATVDDILFYFCFVVAVIRIFKFIICKYELSLNKNSNIMIIDLTELYGLDREPSKKEFEEILKRVVNDRDFNNLIENGDFKDV